LFCFVLLAFLSSLGSSVWFFVCICFFFVCDWVTCVLFGPAALDSLSTPSSPLPRICVADRVGVVSGLVRGFLGLLFLRLLGLFVRPGACGFVFFCFGVWVVQPSGAVFAGVRELVGGWLGVALGGGFLALPLWLGWVGTLLLVLVGWGWCGWGVVICGSSVGRREEVFCLLVSCVSGGGFVVFLFDFFFVDFSMGFVGALVSVCFAGNCGCWGRGGVRMICSG